VVGQLELHRALQQPLGELAEQATRAGDLLLGLSAGPATDPAGAPVGARTGSSMLRLPVST
jgi:hypothetical protein